MTEVSINKQARLAQHLTLSSVATLGNLSKLNCTLLIAFFNNNLRLFGDKGGLLKFTGNGNREATVFCVFLLKCHAFCCLEQCNYK